MWPPLWGYYYWWFIHSAAKAYGSRDLTDDEQQGVKRFFEALCGGLLPCPACGLHCLDHLSADPLKLSNGTEFWKYTVDFHNAVNKRTHKLQVTYEEAEAMLAKSLDRFGGPTKVQDFWHILLFACMIFTRTPDECLSDEREALIKLVDGACFMFPFTQDNQELRGRMLQFVHDNRASVVGKETAVQLVLNLFNHTAAEIGVFPMTKEEFVQGFFSKFNHKEHLSLVRSHQIREEDHIKMTALQEELVNTRDQRNWQAMFWASATVNVCAALFLFFIYVYIKRRKLRVAPSDEPSGRPSDRGKNMRLSVANH